MKTKTKAQILLYQDGVLIQSRPCDDVYAFAVRMFTRLGNPLPEAAADELTGQVNDAMAPTIDNDAVNTRLEFLAVD